MSEKDLAAWGLLTARGDKRIAEAVEADLRAEIARLTRERDEARGRVRLLLAEGEMRVEQVVQAHKTAARLREAVRVVLRHHVIPGVCPDCDAIRRELEGKP